jgi:exodeoxyribonuclease VII small subunit
MAAQKNKPAADTIAIESTMKSIETLLEKLENNDTSLDQSLAAFEEGINLVRSAQTTLAQAEQKVQLLLEKDGNPAPAAFDFDENNG